MRAVPACFLLSLVLGCASRDDASRAQVAASATTLSIVRHAVPIARIALPPPRVGSNDVRVLGPRLRFEVPPRARGALRVSTSSDHGVSVAPDLERDAAPEVDGDATIYRDVARDEDLVYVDQGERIEELRVLRSDRARTTFAWTVRATATVARLRLRDGFVEALDEEGRARLRMDPIAAIDARGTHRALDVTLDVTRDGGRLEAKLDTRGLAFPVVVDPGWGPATTLPIPQNRPQTIALPSGKVLFVGGYSAVTDSATSMMATVAVFDPTTNTFTLGAPMSVPRGEHRATLLQNGKVLVTGGGFNGVGSSCRASAEIYDPATDVWTTVAPMPNARMAHAQILLTSGKVLVAVGLNCASGSVASGTVYDPVANTWTASLGTITAHARPGYGRLGDGRAVIAGGFPGLDASSKLDVYDPTTNTLAAGPDMSLARETPGAIALPGGRVWFVGGREQVGSWQPLSTTEAFDPSNAWVPRASLPAKRDNPGLALLTTGKVLIASGNTAESTTPTYQPIAETLLYDPTTDTITNAGNLSYGRDGAGVAALPGGRALIAGGRRLNGTTSVLATTAEIWGDATAQGSPCFATGACASGFCVDGVCCSTRCGGQCESCNEPASAGTCKLVTGAPRGSRGACAGTGACAGACDGLVVSCTMPPTTTLCQAATCSGGIATGPAHCDGAGQCGAPTPATTACAPYSCGALGCKTSCNVDADCVSTAYCDTATSVCVVKKAQGTTCGGATQCLSGFCESGVCCASTCTGSCNSCNETGSQGVCTVISGCTTDAGPPDASAGDTAITVSDTGTSSTDAGLGVAETPAPTLPAVPSVAGDYQRCNKPSDCASGFCVDGVCCDSACQDKCHSCALLDTPGRCTLEPIGVDLRQDCGPANQCLGTCGGNGQCIGSGAGTMCARNRCTGASTGLGPAYCAAPGAACTTNEAVAFECSPYTCEPAFGACRATCAGSADCANGFVCDVPAKSCVKVPPVVEDSGCACSTPGPARTGVELAGALLGVSITIARRRSADRLRSRASR